MLTKFFNNGSGNISQKNKETKKEEEEILKYVDLFP